MSGNVLFMYQVNLLWNVAPVVFLMQLMSGLGDYSFELALLISLKNFKEIISVLPLPSPASGGDLLHGAGPQVHLPEAAV